MTFRDVIKLPEFEKDLKRLKKKYKSLDDDLRIFIKAQLILYHKEGIDNRGIVRIPGLVFEYPKLYKARKFACRYLKGRGSQTGIRIIYAYFDKENRIELVEMYFKADKENEDRERIKKLFGGNG